jgi:hypothetical protein
LSLHDQLSLDFGFGVGFFLPEFCTMSAILPPDTGQCRELFVIQVVWENLGPKNKLGHYPESDSGLGQNDLALRMRIP